MSISERLCHEPYRLLFPLGIALSWVGVGQWVLHGTGVIKNYLSIFHSMVQVQGFLMAFAAGFLLTMVPRRTQSPGPRVWQLGFVTLCLVAFPILAWFELWPPAQFTWMALAVFLTVFVSRRLFSRSLAKRRAPVAFVWLPIGLGIGLAGSILAGIGAGLPDTHWWLHEIGRVMTLQGMFVALALGVGGLVFPLMTRGEAAPDAEDTSSSRRVLLGHLAGALLLLASFPIETRVNLSAGMGLRAAVILGVYVLGAGLHRRPARPGATRWIIWLAAWCLPLGFVWAAVDPGHWKAGVHFAMIGGFGSLLLGVGAQVVVGLGGRDDLKNSWPWPVVVAAALVVLAIGPRVLMEYDPARFFSWLVAGASMFVAGTVVWMVYLARWMSWTASE